MKDRPLQPPSDDPSTDKDEPLFDQGMWKHLPIDNQEWRDAPIDDDEAGIWGQTLLDENWQDAPTEENETGIWEGSAIAPTDWQDAPINEDETGIWEQTAIAPTDWQDAPVNEDETGIWEGSAIAPTDWQDAPVNEDETGIWEQTAIAPTDWQDAPIKDEEHQEGMVFLPKIVESLSYPLIPLIGYGFLGLSLFDHINIIYPVEIYNPSWIVETIGQISERIPIVWIGLLLVFFRREGYVRKGEMVRLKFLSWLCLFLGIIYLILIPMMIGNTVRLGRVIDTQIEAKTLQQKQRLQRARDQVSQTKEQDISAYLRYQSSQTGLSQSITPEKFKQNLLQKANRDITELTANSQALKSSQVGDLIKRTIKWSLGNLLATFICIWIWHLTRWTRIKNLELDSKL